MRAGMSFFLYYSKLEALLIGRFIEQKGGFMNKRPHRRRSKDNPYTLNYCEELNVYVISFKDAKGILQKIEVSEEIYKVFDKFELDDVKELNEYDRHIEHSEIFENRLNVRAVAKPTSLEDSVIRNATFDELSKAIELLPETQKRRIKKYYFDGKNEYQIAIEEHTTQQAVNKTIKVAKEKLKKFLKN